MLCVHVSVLKEMQITNGLMVSILDNKPAVLQHTKGSVFNLCPNHLLYSTSRDKSEIEKYLPL